MAAPSPSSSPAVVATSVWSYLQSRLAAVHVDRRMGAFAGPPGIGKTTAINSYVRSRPRQVARVLVRQPNARPTAVMQAMIAAIRTAANIEEASTQSDTRRLEASLDRAIREWEWRTSGTHDDIPLMLVFDEAQNLSPENIELLRFWNDGTESVPPLGIVFSGNDRFRLESGNSGPSFLSAAVVSRAGRNRKTWTYADITDADIKLFSESKGVTDPSAIAGVVAHARLSPVNRDLRMLGDHLDRALRVAGERPVSGDLIASLFAL